LEVHVKDTLYTFYSETDEKVSGKDRILVKSRKFDRYYDMMYNFSKMVRGEMENPYSYEYETKLFETILRCCKVENE